MARNTEKHLKLDTHTCGPGIWQENWQMRKRRNSHNRTWNIARNTKKSVKWDTTLVDLEYGEKTHKGAKGETHIVGHEIWWETPKNMWNETHTLVDLVYGEKTDKRGKGETHIVGHEIWQEILKKRVKWETNTVGQ